MERLLLGLCAGVASAALLFSTATAFPLLFGATKKPRPAAPEPTTLCAAGAATKPASGLVDADPKNKQSVDPHIKAVQRMLGKQLQDSGVPVEPHPYDGTKFKTNVGIAGGCASQHLTTEVKFSNVATIIYTPTLYPPLSCIEMSTTLQKSGNFIGSFDWCPTEKEDRFQFTKKILIDDAFMKTYLDKDKNYLVRVYQSDKASNTWTSEIYNYATNEWNSFWQRKGVNKLGADVGWNIDEMWDRDWPGQGKRGCPDRKGLVFESSSIMTRVNDKWALADSNTAASWGRLLVLLPNSQVRVG